MIIACLAIGACTGVNVTQWHFPYMMKVQQGTYITEEQYKQLKIGMTEDQVAYIIEKPLSQFMFDPKRWDFPYQEYKNNHLIKRYNLTVLFDRDGKVTSVTKSGELFAK